MMPVNFLYSTIKSFVRRRTIWAPSESLTTIRNTRTKPEFENWKYFVNLLLPNKVKLNINKVRIALLDKKPKSIELV